MQLLRHCKIFIDFAITMIFWVYFIVGYILLFLPLLIVSCVTCNKKEVLFQHINNLFFRSFFCIVRLIIPNLTLNIDDKIKTIHSSVIISNHRSYIDPILLVSLLRRHVTIVKGVFFHIPVFGWILKGAGYIPFFGNEMTKPHMYDKIMSLKEYIHSGGNIFIFPEGKRSRDGKLGTFKNGAFRIAKLCNAPIVIVYLENTDALYKPGNFLLNTCINNVIRVEVLGSTNRSFIHKPGSINNIINKVRTMYERRMNIIESEDTF